MFEFLIYIAIGIFIGFKYAGKQKVLKNSQIWNNFITIRYLLNGKEYTYITKYNRLMSARGIHVKDSKGKMLNFHPGVIPDLKYSEFYPERENGTFTVHDPVWGYTKVEDLTNLRNKDFFTNNSHQKWHQE